MSSLSLSGASTGTQWLMSFRQTTSFSLTANCYVKSLERSMQVAKTLLAGD